MSNLAEEVRQNLIKILPNYDNIVIAYSGGKDSTLVVHFFLLSLENIRKKLNSYILFADTRVEIPLIVNLASNFLKKVREWCKVKDLKVHIETLHPDLKDSFWVQLIGKGYQPPTFLFRWCVKRLKVKPFHNFLKNLKGKTILLLGLRSEESSLRKERLKKEGWISKNKNIDVYSPIFNWTAGDVWDYLLKNDSPWGESYSWLFDTYLKATESCISLPYTGFKCNGSRFGCWTCTVIRKDNTLERLSKYYKEYKELLNFKLMMMKMANNPKYRSRKRTDGTSTKKRLGPLNIKGRKLLLKKLIKLQKRLNMNIITQEEIKMIKEEWEKIIN